MADSACAGATLAIDASGGGNAREHGVRYQKRKRDSASRRSAIDVGDRHLDLSHGTTGLQVGTLNDQHPWLYKATNLTVHPVAQDYRQRTLLQRGPLRGADYVLMRELVRAQEALERVRPARSVADELQQFPQEAQAPVHEPRLVRVGSTVRQRASGKDAEDGLSRVAEN